MISLSKIELKDFISHSDTVLDIKPEQKLLVDGVSGSGKSSIVDGLIWCLYGKSRTSNRSLIKNGKTSASVTVILQDDDRLYRVVRSINNKGKHELEIFEKELKAKTFKPSKVSGIKNIQEYLEKQILKSSYLLFINSIVYPQENIENFVRQPASKRKDLILEIINAADYDDYLDKTKKLLSDKRTEKEVIKNRISYEESFLYSLTETSSKLEEYKSIDVSKKEELNDVEDKIKDVNDKLNEIQVREMVYHENLKRIESVRKEIDELLIREKDLDQKITDIDNLKNNLEESKLKLSELPLLKFELENYYKAVTDYNIWNSKMIEIIKETPASIDYDDQIDRANKQIIEVLSSKIDECSELKKPCPVLVKRRQETVEKMNENVKRLKKEKEDLEILKEIHQSKIKQLGEAPKIVDSESLEAIRSKITSLEALDVKMKESESKIASYDEINSEIKRISSKITELRMEEIRFSKENYKLETDRKIEISNELSTLQFKKQSLNLEINDNTVKLTLASEASRKIDKYKISITELKEGLDKIEQQTESLEILKEAFGPNGIKAIVVDLIIPQLEDKINNILSKLSEFRVKLETQKSGVGEKTIIEGLFINIINDQGEELEFESYSGGERLKIIVSISEALSEVQRIGFRILDELFIGLDEESTEKFASVMTSLQEKFKQMICISHLRGIKDLFEDKVTVTKINGTSKIN